uniref:Putative copper binding protein, plastocyanin/azurin family protein n=1 Tax=uncultured marine microorganism HF4000_ANIW141A21 TaxID=455535 RepID=B3T565_9ZZZZ|nr:putative copper binding protein, plastocyanin/azurin family protein [uncultured marine microorganism HF4000_ANIW141A21]
MASQKQVAAIIVGVLVIAISLVVVIALLPSGGPSAPPSQPSTPEQPEALQPSTIRINLNLGEVELSGPYGFALDDGKINSPGPQIVVKVGDVIIINVLNVGQLPHSFAIAAEAKEGADPLFNSQIGSGSSPVVAGETGTVTFTVGQAGTYSYICQVPGHATIFEMFGTFLVEA